MAKFMMVLALLACAGCEEATSTYRRAPVSVDAKPIRARVEWSPSGSCAVKIPTDEGGALSYFESSSSRCLHLMQLAKEQSEAR